MDSLCSSPSTSSANYSFSSFATATNIPPDVLWVGTGRGRDSSTSTVSQMLGRLIWVTLTCNFAIVCSFIGAMMGGLIGLATEIGFFRGAGIGSMSAAVFSVEVIESTITLWRSNGLGIWTFLYMIDIVLSLLSGSLFREKVVPAMQSALHSQMSVADSLFIVALDIFDTEGTKGLPKDSVDKLPKFNITTKSSVDPSGDTICCSVCLQDFKVGETARSLPHCQHMFHLPCIDGWLTMHGSCPLCRRRF